MKNFYLAFFLFALIGISSPLFAQVKTIPYQELPQANGQPTGSGMFFGATMSASTVTITFGGPSDRWIAFGLGLGMYPTDVFIYSNGRSGATHPLGWNDYFNSNGGQFGVNNDPVQNWSVISTGTFAPAQRTVTATRVLNTGNPDDVAFNYNAAALDLVWAHGATPDYTIAYHGNNNRAYFISLPWLSAPSASFISSSTVCAGAAITYTNFSTGGLTSYSWSFQGGVPATSTLSNPTVVYPGAGTYSVALTASNAIGSDTYTQLNYITVTNTVLPSVNIALSGGTNPMCAGAPVTFTASGANTGNAPVFQWMVNGQPAGQGSAFTTTLSSAVPVTCVMNSNATCATPQTVSSAAINMTVNSNAPASVSIGIASGSNPLCVGAAVVFTAVPGNGGTNPAYQWLVNGSPTGVTANSFTTSTLANGDLVGCELTSNAACASSTLGLALPVTMTISSVLIPSITISTTNNAVCAGTILNFTAVAFNAGSQPQYQWQINGSSLPNTSPFFNSASFLNNDVVTCQLTSGLQCASPSSVISNPLTVTIYPVPVAPTITSSGALFFCAGGSVSLSSSAATGNLWSNGNTTQSITVTATGSFSVSQNLNGCVSAPSSIINVSVVPLPTVAVFPVAPVCKNTAPFNLIGMPPGGAFNGQGVFGNVFQPQAASTESVNMISYEYTDANNCSATAVIQISVNECLGLSSYSNSDQPVSVFPNPGKGEFTFYSAFEKITEVEIQDLSGRIVKSTTVDPSILLKIDLSSRPNGVYIVKLKQGEKITMLRLIKKD